MKIPTKKEIIGQAEKNEGFFHSFNIPYEIRGVFTSEALLIVSMAKLLNVNLLIESGRARGYSTKIISDFFKNQANFKIISIDFDKNSADAKYSEENLSDYKNLKLVYGDANKILTKEITEECVIFIDGPKGDEAILLASEILKNPLVKAIMVHDLHKNTFHRNIFEIVFNHTFFSDDKEYVEKFSYLDKSCWDTLKNHDESPYYRKGQKIESYASTLAIAFNDTEAMDLRVFENYKSYYKNLNNDSLKKYIYNKTKSWPAMNRFLNKIYKLFK